MVTARKQYDSDNPRLPAFCKRFRILSDKVGGVTKMSDLLGISRPTIQFWYNGQRTPDAENLCAISKMSGVSVDYLLGMSDVETRVESIQISQRTTGLSEEAIATLMCCSDEIIEIVNKIILSIGD